MRRALRRLGDIVIHLFRANTVWGFVKHTKVGHLMVSGSAATLVLVYGVSKSDPLLVVIVVVAIVFAAVFFIFDRIGSVKRSPRLRYIGITGTSETPRIFFVDGRPLHPLFVEIRNEQTSVDIAANGVTATVQLKDFDPQDRSNINGSWLFAGAPTRFVDKTRIESGQSGWLVLLFEGYPATETDQSRFLVTDKPGVGVYTTLKPGDWRVEVEVKQDNGAPIILTGKFKITNDYRLCLNPNGKPCLRQRLLWN
jgi:hypothetical protein